MWVFEPVADVSTFGAERVGGAGVGVTGTCKPGAEERVGAGIFAAEAGGAGGVVRGAGGAGGADNASGAAKVVVVNGGRIKNPKDPVFAVVVAAVVAVFA